MDTRNWRQQFIKYTVRKVKQPTYMYEVHLYTLMSPFKKPTIKNPSSTIRR